MLQFLGRFRCRQIVIAGDKAAVSEEAGVVDGEVLQVLSREAAFALMPATLAKGPVGQVEHQRELHYGAPHSHT